MVLTLKIHTLKAAMEHLGVESLPIHSTRHTHAVMLLEAGWSMKVIQERLGHESMKTTSDIYSHISESYEQKSMDQFNDFMKSLVK
ncbi:tyrosine-type recombinase/integrase [Psychrobacillus sp. FSL H8-0484]|uniref:tyrosine-type recombinase/integrase n=1 Tax=unclassified Psychrobacillus TaxID=2636677 RepID=UPI0030FCFBF5